MHTHIHPQRTVSLLGLQTSIPHRNRESPNPLIDVIAEAGPYPPGETDLRKFIVEGEKRYWLHIAIGRRRDKRDNGSTR